MHGLIQSEQFRIDSLVYIERPQRSGRILPFLRVRLRIQATGTGVRNVPAQTLWKMDVVLMKWQPGDEPVNSEDTLRKAPYDSDLRNKFDLDSLR